MRRRALVRLLWIVAAALALLPWYVPLPGSAAASPSLLVRLLGPVARPAAALEWVRVDTAIRSGRIDVALQRAELAFALDPSATANWRLLSGHLAFHLASPEREPDRERRLTWLRAALEIARRGERSAADPAQLAEWQGLLLSHTADVDPTLWPGGARALWLEAAAAFDRAAALGLAEAAEEARMARAIAARR
jgi:hypothetical protein